MEKLLSSPQYEEQDDLDRLVIITDPDEAAAILNGGNTHDQAGNPPPPRHSPGVKGIKYPKHSPVAKGPMQGETLQPQKLPRTQQTGSYKTPEHSQSGPQWSRAIGKHIAWSHQKQHSRSP